MALDLSLYLVTDAALCSDYGLEQTVEAAVNGGVTVVQLRDKHASDAQMTAQAKRLKELLTGTGVPLIINDRLQVALESQADGLHVGQSDAAVQEARRALGDQAIIGLSINTLAQLQAAPIELLDYGLATLVKACPLPCVAIGGLKASHTGSVQQAGANGLAVISAICGQPDPCQAARAFQVIPVT